MISFRIYRADCPCPFVYFESLCVLFLIIRKSCTSIRNLYNILPAFVR